MNAIVKFLAPMALIGAMVATAALPVMAQGPYHEAVNARIHNQDKRINQGLRAHTINRYQAHNLKVRDARVHAVEHRDRTAHGGHLTVAEHRNIEHRLNKDSHVIYRDKHDIR